MSVIPNAPVASLIERVPADEMLAKQIIEILELHYPKHTWIIEAFAKQGYATIQNPSISYKMGMRLILPKIYTYNDLRKKVIHFAGEFLERHGIARGKADRDETQERWPTARFK